MRLIEFAEHRLQNGVKFRIRFCRQRTRFVIFADFFPVNAAERRIEMFFINGRPDFFKSFQTDFCLFGYRSAPERKKKREIKLKYEGKNIFS